MTFQDTRREILMFEAETFVYYVSMNTTVVELVESFVDFAVVITTDQENVNVNFVDEKMIMHGDKEKFVNFVH